MSKYLTAAEIETYGKAIVDILKSWLKINKGKDLTQYEIKRMSLDESKKNGDDKNPILVKKLEQAFAEAAQGMGIKVTKGMHASKDALVFSSTEEALQHLSNITGAKVMVAEKKKIEKSDRKMITCDEAHRKFPGALEKFEDYQFEQTGEKRKIGDDVNDVCFVSADGTLLVNFGRGDSDKVWDAQKKKWFETDWDEDTDEVILTDAVKFD